MPDRNPVASPNNRRDARLGSESNKSKLSFWKSTDSTTHSSHNESTGTQVQPQAKPLSFFTLSLLGTRASLPTVKYPFGGETNKAAIQHSTDSSDDSFNNNSSNRSNSQRRLRSHNRNRQLLQSTRALSPASLWEAKNTNQASSSSDNSSDSQIQRLSLKQKTKTEKPSHKRRDRNNNMNRSKGSSTNANDSQKTSEPGSETPDIPIQDGSNNNNGDQNANDRPTASSNLNENLNVRSIRNDNENSTGRGAYGDSSPALPRHRPALYRADSGFEAGQASDGEDEDEPSCQCGHDDGASSKTRRHTSQDKHGRHQRHKSLSKSTPLLRKSSFGRCMSWTSLDSAMGGSCTSIDQRRDSNTNKDVGNRRSSLMLSCSSSSTSSTSLSSSLSSSMSSLWSAVSRSSLNWQEAAMDARTWSSPDCSRVATPAPEPSTAIIKPLDKDNNKVLEQSVPLKEQIPTIELTLLKKGETEPVSENKFDQNVTANEISRQGELDPPGQVIQKDTEAEGEPSSGSTQEQPAFPQRPLRLDDSLLRTSELASSSSTISAISRRPRRHRRNSRDLNNNDNMHDGTRPQSYLPTSVGRLGDCLQKNGVVAFIMLLTYTLTLMIGFAVISYVAKGIIAVIGEEDLKEMRKSLTQSRASRRSTATSG